MKKASENGRGIFLSCVYAQAVAVISGIILLLIFCAVAYGMADPDSVTVPLSLCALYLSALIGGIAAVRFSNDGIASGAISGVMTALIVFALSAIPMPLSGFELTTALICNALVIPASVLGSVIGHKRRKSPKSHKAKIKKLRR